MLAVILILVIGFLGFVFYTQNMDKYHFRKWRKLGIKSIDENAFMEYFRTKMQEGAKYIDDKLPFGRAEAFASNFSDIDTDSLRIFGYSPIRSKTKTELREYGILMSSYGLLVSYQTNQKVKNNDSKHKQKGDDVSYQSETYKIPLAGLWSIVVTNKEVIFKYPDGKNIRLNLNYLPEFNGSLIKGLQDGIDCGYTRNLYLLGLGEQKQRTGDQTLDRQIRRAYKYQEWKSQIERNNFVSFVQAMNLSLPSHLKNIQFNSIVGQRQGHGVAAEYANDVLDRARGIAFGKTITGRNTQVGQDNAMGGADRQVGNIRYQTKYCKTPGATVQAYFDKGYQNKGMKLEVPKDQYDAAVAKMADRIKRGEVPNETNPANAKNHVVKGRITYKQAFDIAHALKPTSITIDAIDGALESMPGASISFIIVFAQARWAGMDTKEAIRMSTVTAMKTLAAGTLMYSGSQQIGKLIAKPLDMEAEQVAKYAGWGITVAVVYGPSVIDAIRGRISVRQLVKNATVSTAGMAAGALAGAVAGPIGMVVGGMVGGYASKKIADHFVADDAEEMYQIIREEFLDSVPTSGLNQQEIQEIIQRTFMNPKLSKIMKDMFQSKQPREYAKIHLMDENIQDLLRQRPHIDDDEIYDAVETEPYVFEMA